MLKCSFGWEERYEQREQLIEKMFGMLSVFFHNVRHISRETPGMTAEFDITTAQEPA